MEARPAMISANGSRGRAGWMAAARGHAAALAIWAIAGLAVPTAHAARRGIEPVADGQVPRIAASILTLDFDPRDGATVVGITSSAPLLNHTVYERDASTVVVEIPDVDVSRLEPVATIGTPEVAQVRVEAMQRAGSTTARFEIARTPGVRRSVTIDPKNANRLEIKLESAATASPAGAGASATPAPPPRILAGSPAPSRAAAPAEVRASIDSPAARTSLPASSGEGAPSPAAIIPASPATAAPRPVPQPVVPHAGAAGYEHPGAGALGATSAPAPPAMSPRGPGKLTDLTVERARDGRTLIRLTSTRPIDARSFVMERAPRLVLDLENTINALPFANLPVRDSEVLKVRVSQFEPFPNPVTRVVVDWSADQPHELIPGPDALLIAIGARSSSSPAMASADPSAWGAAPLSGPDEALISGPATGSLANLGRPVTSAGAAPPPLPAGTPNYRRPLRETADAGGFLGGSTQAGAAQGTRFDEVRVTQEAVQYSGDPISISVKDADLQDLFRLFHEVSGFNIVVDPSVKGKSITLELLDVPWDQALDLVLRTTGLGQSLEGNVLRIAPITKLAQEEQQSKQLKEAQELSGDVISIAFPLSYASGSAAEQIIRKNLSQRGDVVLDRRTNTLIIKDLPDRLESIKALLALLDLPTKQVMIEARIVETTLDFSKAVGIQWGFSYIADRAFGNSTGFSFPRSVATDYAVNLPVSAAASVLGLSFRNILNTFALDLQISALEDRGKARIISRPMVMVQNNESAEIESGVQIPISNTTATEISTTFVSASLRLSVQPQITADDTVIMNVTVENNAPVFIQSVGDNTSISTRQAKTVVAVPDGGTTVIGGIYQVNEGAASTRVPFLSRVPLLGWLFRNKTINRTNDELLIFITPRIQRN